MKTYQYTDSTNTVVSVIEEDGMSYKSMLVVGRDDNITSDYQEYLDWIAQGRTPSPAPSTD
jgi:hypothetical protein